MVKVCKMVRICRIWDQNLENGKYENGLTIVVVNGEQNYNCMKMYLLFKFYFVSAVYVLCNDIYIFLSKSILLQTIGAVKLCI